ARRPRPGGSSRGRAGGHGAPGPGVGGGAPSGRAQYPAARRGGHAVGTQRAAHPGSSPAPVKPVGRQRNRRSRFHRGCGPFETGGRPRSGATGGPDAAFVSGAAGGADAAFVSGAARRPVITALGAARTASGGAFYVSSGRGGGGLAPHPRPPAGGAAAQDGRVPHRRPSRQRPSRRGAGGGVSSRTALSPRQL